LYINTVQIKVPKVTKIPDKLPQNPYSNTQKAVPVNNKYLRAVLVNKRYLWAVPVKSRLVKRPEGNKEDALDGLIGHTMQAAEEGAAGLGRGNVCLGPILHLSRQIQSLLITNQLFLHSLISYPSIILA
jgi:hypothetical protein